MPDPLIAAKMGAANTPAWRGTAYVVFEELLLTDFGNRLPQLSFELLRPLDDPDTAEGLVEAVTIIPASGEWAYATEIVRRTEGGRSGWGPGGQIVGGTTYSENVHAMPETPDMLVSLDRLEAMVPAVTGASLVVSWFGDDLRAGQCSIRPKVEMALKNTSPAWSVNGVSRSQALVVSQDDQGRPVYGGTPADFSVAQAIREMRARGLKVTFYPFLMMDIPAGNSLPDPYSDNAAGIGQPVLPWRGRITCAPAAGFAGTVDKTTAAAPQVAAFFGAAQPSDFAVSGDSVTWTGGADWGFRRMILHYAHLCAAAGSVDAFLIGSEMRGLTQVRTSIHGRSWNFGTALGGWSLYHATGGVLGGALTLTPNNANPRLLHNAATNMDGRKVRYMIIDFERIAPRTTGTWTGRILYGTENHALSLSYQVRFADPPLGVRVRTVVDMWSLTSGGADWKNSTTISNLRIDIEEGGPDSSFRIYGIHFTDAAPDYPAVEEFRTLAADVRAILGSGTKISYAADWSEYFGHHPVDGSGDVFFHLDPLWADANVDFIGIDNYMPLSDWRDGWDHLDALAWPSIHDRAYLQSNIAGGEGFDWFYASETDRIAQNRTPITDGVAGKPWVFRTKDLHGWWSNPHFDRPGGVESGSPTAWLPQSKPIRFTELGCPAVDRGTNQPNVFHDPKSSESFFPHFSRGWRDDAIQRAYLEATYLFWRDSANNPVSTEYAAPMANIGNSAAWTWDARPYPFFPELSDVWSDGGNWRLGHWLTGRLGAVSLAALVRQLCLRAGLPEAWVDVSGLTGAVDGYVISALESPRTSITMLARHFGFDAVESEGRIRFVMRGSAPVMTIAPDGMVSSGSGDVMELTRGQETELPQALKWQVARADEDYDPITVEARRITVSASRVSSDGFPMAVPPEEADRRCRRALMAAWVGRETAAFRLPPSRLALDPGDVIALDHDGRHSELRIISTSDAEARGIEAIRQDRDAYDLPPGTPRPASLTQPVLFGAPLAVIIDLPQLTEDHVAHHPLIAAHARPWPGRMAVFRSPDQDGFDLLTTFSARARMGVLVADLHAGPTSRFDYGNVVYVDLLTGALESVTDLRLFRGENTIAVAQPGGGWEILQFSQAELIAPGRYRLSRLLRGQRGTDVDMAAMVSEGARVVVLDTALAELPVAEADLGLPWNWRIGPASRPVSDDSFAALAFTPRGIGLRPFAPVHVEQPWRRARVPGDLTISWVRRDRSLAADNWNAAEVPMTEASEAWQVEILDGATVKRFLQVATTKALYTAAQQTADWGAPLGPGASLTVRIAQIGQAYGAGGAAITTLWF